MCIASSHARRCKHYFMLCVGKYWKAKMLNILTKILPSVLISEDLPSDLPKFFHFPMIGSLGDGQTDRHIHTEKVISRSHMCAGLCPLVQYK